MQHACTAACTLCINKATRYVSAAVNDITVFSVVLSRSNRGLLVLDCSPRFIVMMSLSCPEFIMKYFRVSVRTINNAPVVESQEGEIDIPGRRFQAEDMNTATTTQRLQYEPPLCFVACVCMMQHVICMQARMHATPPDPAVESRDAKSYS